VSQNIPVAVRAELAEPHERKADFGGVNMANFGVAMSKKEIPACGDRDFFYDGGIKETLTWRC